jgi:pSer/pThr/pTyr-binding forkhead associated (FHA) protein
MMGTATAPRPKVTVRVVRADGGPESVVAMRSDILTCGKLGDISLPDDPFVATTQARFFFSGARLAIEDLAGGNGVFVRLRKEREVQVSNELRLGRQRLLVEALPPLPALTGTATVMWGSPDPGYRFRLVQILEGGVRGAAFPLKEGENTLGRESGDVTFPSDGFVSGRHAIFRIQQNQIYLRDLGSSNGTFLRLGAPAFVDTGDQYLIGRQLLRVELE